VSESKQIDVAAVATAIGRWPGILGHPAFDAARAEGVDRLAAVLEQQAPMRRHLNDRGRLATASAAYILDPAISVGAIVQMVPASYISRSRVSGFLAILRREGLVEPVDAGRDRRVNTYALAEPVKSAMTDYVEALLAPARPFARRYPASLRDPPFVRRVVRQFALLRVGGLELFEASPIFSRLSDLSGGNAFLLEQMRLAATPLPNPEGPTLARASFARRYGLTRTHVIDLVKLCREQGWIEGPAGQERPSNALAEQGRLYFARQFSVAATLLEQLSE
jgi:hypothetical protein